MRERADGSRLSAEKIRQTGVVVEKKADRLFLFLCIIIFSGLTFYSLRYTEILHEGTEIPWTIVDSVGKNVLALLIVTMVILLLGKLMTERILPEGKASTERRIRILVGIVAVCVTVSCVSWVSVCHVRAHADGEYLCTSALLIMAENYNPMLPPGYMNYYPHQYGMLAVIQILFSLFGVFNYQSFQYMNALCMPLLFYSGYKILRLICKKTEAVVYYILLFVSYVPLFLYVAYVYGEITSITFAMVFMWQIIRYCKTGRESCCVWAALAIVSACMMRMNSIIILAAAGIVLAFYAFRAMKPQAIAWFFVMLFMIFAVNRGIQAYYENISGNEIAEGIPYISWILMGLKDGPKGPGWYDETNYVEFQNHDYDAERTALDNREKVRLRLEELWEDKAYGIDFFRRKILTQWNAPACHSFFETREFTCEPEELPKIVHRIYYEDEAAINSFLDRYQFVLYFYVTAEVILLFAGKRKERLLEDRILLISIVGGFLFHILWEVMGRYALPYVVFMIPMAAIGMGQMRDLLNTAISWLISMGNRSKGSKEIH
ncbi:MAG: hypothetical protein K2P59_07600 [Acetatifactor sp.]|nr:hypothetical protein [Acetatifactor sp.]